MTTVVPPPPSPPPGPVPAPAPTLTVVNPPPALTQLPLGTLIEANLMGAPDKGVTQARSQFGNLNLQSNITLPDSGTVALQIEKLTPQLVLALKALDGKAVGNPARAGQMIQSALQQLLGQKGPGGAQTAQTAAQQAGQPMPGTSQAQPAPGSAPAVAVELGSMVKAIVLRPGALPGGTQTAGKTGQTAPTAAGAVNNPATPSGTLGRITDRGAQEGQKPAGGRVQPGAAANNPVPGTQANLRVISFAPGGQAPTVLQNPSLRSGANILTGRVVGSTPSGSTLVQSPIGLLALETKSPLPAGSSVNFEVAGKMTPPKLQSGLSSVQEIFLSREWPRMDEALTQLGQSAPESLQQLLSNTVPRPNSQLTASLMFFLTALKGGNIRFWLGGGASDALERDRPDLLGRLGEDFGQLSRSFNETPAGAWRTAMFPFYTGENLEQVRMHTKAQDDEEEEAEDTSRFLIDVEMSRLGRIQLDGLIRGAEKRFDLIFRSEEPLPAPMRKDINQIFMDSTDAAGVNGVIAFQAHTKFVEISLSPEDDQTDTGLVV